MEFYAIIPFIFIEIIKINIFLHPHAKAWRLFVMCHNVQSIQMKQIPVSSKCKFEMSGTSLFNVN